jgi:hypothetical protein
MNESTNAIPPVTSEDLALLQEYVPSLFLSLNSVMFEKPYYYCEQCIYYERLPHREGAPHNMTCRLNGGTGNADRPFCTDEQWLEAAKQNLGPVIRGLKADLAVYERVFVEMQQSLIVAACIADGSTAELTIAVAKIAAAMSRHKDSPIFRRYSHNRQKAVSEAIKDNLPITLTT